MRPAAWRSRLAARVALAVVLALAWPAAGTAGPAAASDGPSSAISLCTPHQHLDVDARYALYNDVFGSRKQCLVNQNRSPNFRVSASGAASKNQEPQAFPDIFYGCSRGWCSPGTTLPTRVSALNHPQASWNSDDRAGGLWDSVFDLWFPRTRQTNGQPNGAELMIWLNDRGYQIPTYDHGRYVHIEGASWYFDHWRTCLAGTCWNYVRFWRVHSTSHVSGLWLKPFITAAERSGLIKQSWWLETISAGYELWKDGHGLATTSFSARP
jgi:Glycosyl hydrolase family 12